jgi:hypothetical protein
MQKRIAAIGVIVVGVVVFASAFTANLFTVAPAFEDLTDGFRDTVMTEESVTQARTDIAGLEAVAAEFESTVVPTLAAALEMDPASFAGFLQSEFPAVASGAAALPAVTAQFTDVINLIESQIDNFNQADEIPTGSLPATVVPWEIAIIGLLGVAIGLFMLGGSRKAAIAAVVVGLLSVAGALVLSLVEKSNAADDMNAAFKPVYTEELVTQSQGALLVVGAMGDEMQTAMVPALSAQLGMPPDQMQAFIGETFPATAAALQSMPDAMGRFQGMVGAFDAQLDNYNTISDAALTPVAWVVVIGGVLTAAFGLWALFARKEDADDAAPRQSEPDVSGAKA